MKPISADMLRTAPMSTVEKLWARLKALPPARLITITLMTDNHGNILGYNEQDGGKVVISNVDDRGKDCGKDCMELTTGI